MQILSIRHPQMLRLCQQFTELEYDDGQDCRSCRWTDQDDFDNAFHYATSPATLEAVLAGQPYVKKAHYKFFGETPAGAHFLSGLRDLIKFDRYYTACYSPRGFSGWHSDSEIRGWSQLWTWARSGQGFFRYRDPVTHDIVTLWDEAEWTVKTMRLGDTPQDTIWHCAGGVDISRWSFILLWEDANKDQFDRANQLTETA